MIETFENGLAVGQRHLMSSASPELGRTPRTPSGNHTVQFYHDDSYLETSVANYSIAALKAGDAVVVLATPEHRSAIGRQVLDDAALASAASRLLLVDAQETLSKIMPGGVLERARFEEVIGGLLAHATMLAPHVSAYGELVALLALEGKHDQALELEQYWHALLSRHPIPLLCGYPMRSFAAIENAEALQLICDAHDRVYPAEQYPAEGSEDQRRRATTLLQQRSHALELEAEARARDLEQRNADLLAAMAARDQFLTAAAHELKTPITSLRVYAQLLQRDVEHDQAVSPDRLQVALQAIERQTGQLNQLVNRLLDLAQIESGTLRIELVEADLIAIVRTAMIQHERCGTHRFVLDAPERLVLPVDPIRFEQVLTILLGNAVKFSPFGSTVTVDVAGNPDGSVELGIDDEGSGVAFEQRELIFQRFQQAHKRHELAGLGLSLPIARRIVELHGGTIRAESARSSGARFVVTLPADPFQG
jgi:signal transduction histidine kinase